MSIRRRPLLPFALAAALAAPSAVLIPAATTAAEEAPAVADDAAVEAALAKFKEDFKAKGLKGDDRISQKDFALATLAKLQHVKVVDALASASRDNDPIVRELAVIYLGDQKAVVGAAGKRIVEAMTRGPVPDAFRMTCLQQIGRLRYLGARDTIKDGLKSQNWAVKKSAIATAGRTGDLRMIRDLVAVIGVEVPADGAGGSGGDGAGGKEVVSEGYSWEGAEASVDTGTPGDSDQKAAEAQAKAQADANRAAAEKSQGGGGGGPGSEGGARGKGGTARSPKELIPNVLGALKQLTGQAFSSPGEFKRWYAQNRADLAQKMKALDEQEKAQKAGK